MLTIPLNAVTTRNGKKVVFLFRNDQAVAVPVTTGKDAGALVEITQGLSAGDRVITLGQYELTDGSKVQVKK